jgi:hypothetical protein
MSVASDVFVLDLSDFSVKATRWLCLRPNTRMHGMLFYGAVANYWIEVTRSDADLSPSAQRALGDRPSAFAGKGQACRSGKAGSAAAENEAKSAPSPPPIPGSIHLYGGAASLRAEVPSPALRCFWQFTTQ